MEAEKTHTHKVLRVRRVSVDGCHPRPICHLRFGMKRNEHGFNIYSVAVQDLTQHKERGTWACMWKRWVALVLLQSTQDLHIESTCYYSQSESTDDVSRLQR